MENISAFVQLLFDFEDLVLEVNYSSSISFRKVILKI